MSDRGAASGRDGGAAPAQGAEAPPPRGALREVALVFLRLGATAFGGPAAHIALMEDELVRRRRWVTRERFLDLLGAANVVPGPTSTELAIHLGHVRAGFAGLVVGGVSFILPAFLIVLAIGWAYVRYGALPAIEQALYGGKPVMVAVVLQALLGLGRTALAPRGGPRRLGLVAVGIAALAAAAAGAHELAVVFGAGLAVAVAHLVTRKRAGGGGAALGLAPLPALAPLLSLGAAAAPPAAAAVPFGLGALFAVFLKIGAVLVGSGYVLLAFLRGDLVHRLGWLTEAQLLDAIAVGQVTPGPVFTAATFIGYLLGGPVAAAVATVAIFLPAFVFVAVSGLLLPLVQRSPVARAALDGINVGSLAAMAMVTYELGRAAIVDLPTVAIAAVATGLLLRLRASTALLLAGGAAAGWVVAALGLRG